MDQPIDPVKTKQVFFICDNSGEDPRYWRIYIVSLKTLECFDFYLILFYCTYFCKISWSYLQKFKDYQYILSKHIINKFFLNKVLITYIQLKYIAILIIYSLLKIWKILELYSRRSIEKKFWNFGILSRGGFRPRHLRLVTHQNLDKLQ